MTEPGLRMADGSKPPDERSLSDWLGEEMYLRWTQVVDFIRTSYPGVFEPEWLFGGKKHGWNLRYKKSKSFCTLIPERGRVMIQIVFGAKEREEAESILPQLTPHVREHYENATTYHDGKWLFLAVDNDAVLADMQRLLTVKRKPRSTAS